MVTTADQHEPCADCVRCATCRREWCPTVTDRCPGEESWWMHPTGHGNVDSGEYCYKCTVCPGGYFQYYIPGERGCTEVKQPPHFALDGKGWD